MIPDKGEIVEPLKQCLVFSGDWIFEEGRLRGVSEVNETHCFSSLKEVDLGYLVIEELLKKCGS